MSRAIPKRARWVAAAMWLGGQSYPQIGSQFGVSREVAREAVRWVAKELGLVQVSPYGTRSHGSVRLEDATEFERRLRARREGVSR